jgi:hypothetical protein
MRRQNTSPNLRPRALRTKDPLPRTRSNRTAPTVERLDPKPLVCDCRTNPPIDASHVAGMLRPVPARVMAKVFQYKYSATLRQKVARFKRVLRKNPDALCPPFAKEGRTAAKHADYKHTTRAWDIARIELGLVTPMDVQRENSPFERVPGFTPRIIQFATYEPRRSRASRVR